MILIIIAVLLVIGVLGWRLFSRLNLDARYPRIKPPPTARVAGDKWSFKGGTLYGVAKSLWDNGAGGYNWLKITLLGVITVVVVSQLPNTPLRITSISQIPIFILGCVGLGVGFITAPWEKNWVRRLLLWALSVALTVQFTCYFFPEIFESTTGWLTTEFTTPDNQGYKEVGWVILLTLLISWALSRQSQKGKEPGRITRWAFGLFAVIVVFWGADKFIFPNTIRQQSSRVTTRRSLSPPYQYSGSIPSATAAGIPVITESEMSPDWSRATACSPGGLRAVAEGTEKGVVIRYYCLLRPSNRLVGFYVGFSDHAPEAYLEKEDGESGKLQVWVHDVNGKSIKPAPGSVGNPIGIWMSLELTDARGPARTEIRIHKDRDR